MMVTRPSIELSSPGSPSDMRLLGELLREYAASLQIDLCFQGFEDELKNLPGDYAEPRGSLLLARVETQLAGCCGLRPLDTVDYPNACEMKRLYVRPAWRNLGLGRRLAEATLDNARMAGYSCVLLDTLDGMETARAMYQELGFEEIPPYYFNPNEGAHYLKVNLRALQPPPQRWRCH